MILVTNSNDLDERVAKMKSRQDLVDYLSEMWVLSETTKRVILHGKDAMISDEELQRRKEAGQLSHDHEKQPKW